MAGEPRLQLVLGGPGCGKTTELLNIVQREMARGVAPHEIAFVTFTKAAADVAAERAARTFGLTAEDLPWFRTIHSLAYRQLGVQRDEVMDARDWLEFSELVGERVTGKYESDVVVGGEARDGDKMLRVVDYAATTMRPLDDAWHLLAEAVDWHRLKRFSAAFTAYKARAGKLDFTDMLLRYAQDDGVKALPVRVAVVDEAQDLTPVQWRAVQRAFADAERLYVGGDDDQAIYHWAGADVERFLSLSTTPRVLRTSHRLPQRVHAFAQGLAGRISQRYRKLFVARDDAGAVEHHAAPEHVDLSRSGTWLLLARNGYMLPGLVELARAAGVPYALRSVPEVRPDDVRAARTWEALRSGRCPDLSAGEVRLLCTALDRPKPQLRELATYSLEQFCGMAGVGAAELNRPWFDALTGIPSERRNYYLMCRRRGESLTASEPRVRVNTIHGVKGAEADHVLVLSDISQRTMAGYRQAPDHEHRVFYVGATRAKQSLHVVAPQTNLAYPLN